MGQITHHELLDPAEIVFVINLRFFEKKEIRNFYLIYLLFKLLWSNDQFSLDILYIFQVR